MWSGTNAFNLDLLLLVSLNFSPNTAPRSLMYKWESVDKHPGANHVKHALWNSMSIACFYLKEEPQTMHFGLLKSHFKTAIFVKIFWEEEKERDVILSWCEDYFSPFAQVQIAPVTCGMSVLIVQSPDYLKHFLPETFFDEELAYILAWRGKRLSTCIFIFRCKDKANLSCPFDSLSAGLIHG